MSVVATMTRYEQHRAKRVTLPPVRGRVPWVLTESLARFDRLCTRADLPSYRSSDLRLLQARLVLLRKTDYRGLTDPQHYRLRRDQALHSMAQVGKYLLARTNVTLHDSLRLYQIRRCTVDDIAAATGFHRSTVHEVLRILTEAGCLVTERHFKPTSIGMIDTVATRYFTERFFKLLGVHKKILKSRRKHPKVNKLATARQVLDRQHANADREMVMAFNRKLRGDRPPPDG